LTDDPQLPEVDPVAHAYLSAHVTRCSTLDPRHLGGTIGGEQRPVSLEAVYVSVALATENPVEVAADNEVTSRRHGEQSVPQSAQDDLLTLEDSASAPAVQFADILRSRRWITLLGDPGTGKTTLLHWLALLNARALIKQAPRVVVDGTRLGEDAGSVDLGPTRLPVLFRAADYVQSAAEDTPLPDILDYIGLHPLLGERLQGDGPELNAMIRRWLASGRALILIDGLDEVTNSLRRAEVVRAVDGFARDHVVDPLSATAFPWAATDFGEQSWYERPSEPAVTAGNQILVTSRRHAYKQTPLRGPFTVLQARPLSLAAIRRFCRRWTLAVEQAENWEDPEIPRHEIEQRAASAADELFVAVTSHRNIVRLASNPLLLTVLAMLHRAPGSGTLPTRRLDLYEQAARALVERRKLSWDFDQVREILGPFALWLHKNSTTGYARRQELVTCLEQGLRRHVANVDTHVPEFIIEAQSQAGLLVELGPDLYGFAHNTFREYLAGIELTRDHGAYPGWLLDHLHEVAWIEVVLMSVASFANLYPGEIDALLSRVLEQEPDLEKLLHHDLLLVADCLAETQRGTPEFVGRVIRRLLRAGSEAEAKQLHGMRARTAEALGDLLERRSRVAEPELIEALRDASVAVLATDVLAASELATPELLDALDRVCQQAERAASAVAARTAVASRLIAMGIDVEARLHPIGTLYTEHQHTYDELETLAPGLWAGLEHFAEDIDPGLRSLIHWALTTAAEGEDLDGEALEALVFERYVARRVMSCSLRGRFPLVEVGCMGAT
jgi:hypothetical protein